MVQTQLLKLDPPYQIISARGYVGIQVATLIEVREMDTSQKGRFGNMSPWMEYHSYPIVNYGLKAGLEEELKYNRTPWDEAEDWKIRRRMQPEGAIWSGVDIKDVRILGIAGANNDAVDLLYFVHLVPTAYGMDPSLRVWDEKSTSRIYELYQGLGNVGLETQRIPSTTYRLPNGETVDTKYRYPITLSYEHNQALDTDFIKVTVKERTYEYPGEEDNSVYFRCQIAPKSSESIGRCASTIAEALNCLVWFLPSYTIDIRLEKIEGEDNHAKDINRLLEQVKECYHNLRYPKDE